MWTSAAIFRRVHIVWQKKHGTGNRESKKKDGAVVETTSIYLDMTAEENLKQQYSILGIPSFDGIDEILTLVGLEQTGKKKAKNFPLGMRQRLGIAISLAGDPDFLVLDEPTNGLDPQGIIEIRELILKLNRERQITVLISSHILAVTLIYLAGVLTGGIIGFLTFAPPNHSIGEIAIAGMIGWLASVSYVSIFTLVGMISSSKSKTSILCILTIVFDSPWRLAIYSLFLSIALTAIGMATFCKKDLK